MPAKQRSFPQQFEQQYSMKPNLLVSGCSFTWNNSEEYAVTWPYYLRDIAGVKQVFDCSQMGSGSNLAFTSVINELESNKNLTAENTTVIIMWSGLNRVDVIAEKTLVQRWSNIETHVYDQKSQLSCLSLFHNKPDWKSDSEVENLRRQYRLLIDTDAQVLESALRIIALDHYLKSRGFNHVMLTWAPMTELSVLDSEISTSVKNIIAPVETLKEFAKLPCGHPSPDAHLMWTRERLIPYLLAQNQLKTLTP